MAHTCDVLVSSALQQAKVFVHRDYMPRNLMLSEPNPGILDFQDAVYGPISYDITSLFKMPLSVGLKQRVTDWLQEYWRKAQACELAVPQRFEDFQRDSDLMARKGI